MNFENYPIYRTGIGQDSHRFLSFESSKPCVLAGIIFENMPGFSADSDGDVIYHAICNAITSITSVPILGNIAIDLCQKDGITDSMLYLQAALKTLQKQKLVHVALSIECKRPRIQGKIDSMCLNIAKILHVNVDQIGITATSGDGLTDFGCGDGVQCFCVITTVEMPSS